MSESGIMEASMGRRTRPKMLMPSVGSRSPKVPDVDVISYEERPGGMLIRGMEAPYMTVPARSRGPAAAVIA